MCMFVLCISMYVRVFLYLCVYLYIHILFIQLLSRTSDTEIFVQIAPSTVSLDQVTVDLLFTIQPTRSTRSSSCLTLSRPPVTSHLTFSKRAISVTAPRLWNDLPPELRTFSLPPPSSLQ